MMQAGSLENAETSLKILEKALGHKHPKSVECVKKDWEELTSFLSFPAEHWQHIKSTNPIESAFATVKLRTKSTKGVGSKEVAESMAFKLLREAEKKWRKIKGFEEIQNLLLGKVYKDGKMIDVKHNQCTEGDVA